MNEQLKPAQTLIEHGYRQPAEALLRQILVEDPSNGEAWHLLGQIVDNPQHQADCIARATAAGYVSERPKTRSWIQAFLWGSIFLFIFLMAIRLFDVLFGFIVQAHRTPTPTTWSYTGISVLGLIVLIFTCLGMILQVFHALTTKQPQARFYARHSARFFAYAISGIILFVVFGISFLFLNQKNVVNPAGARLGLIALGSVLPFLMFFIGPQLLILYRPLLLYQRNLMGLFDILILVATVSWAWGVAQALQILPIWLLVPVIMSIAAIMLVALNAFRNKQSFVQASVDLFSPNQLTRLRNEQEYWRNWLDARLTSQRQQELRRTLLAGEPPSHTRTLADLLLIGGGWWLLTQAIGALIELYIQTQAQNVIP